MMEYRVHKIAFGKPMLGPEEKQAISEVMDSGMLVHGSRIDEFEAAFRSYTGAPHAVGVSNCTAALHLAYFHLGIGPGDEVIVPAMTHTATAHAVELTGARPVFVDAEPLGGNLDLEGLEAAVTAKTRAISVVHFLGLPVDMHRVMAVAQKHGLFVVEDCALALGAFYNGIHMGLHGDVGCFSFYPAKHITTGEGGMLITRHAEVAHAVRRSRAFGMDKHVGERSIPGIYDVQGLGFNYRMSEIHAAIGVEQMKKLPSILTKRKENHARLSVRLSEIGEVELLSDGDSDRMHGHYCHTAILKGAAARKRNDLLEWFKVRGVGCSVYYPSPVPRMGHYKKKYGYHDGAYPVAERIADCSIALPVGPHLGPEDMDIVADTLKEGIAKA